MFYYFITTSFCNHIDRYIEDLRYLQNGIDMSSYGRCKVVGRTALAPTVDKFSCPTGKACPHVGISEGKDLTFFIDPFCSNEFKVSIPVLGDRQIVKTCG